MIFNRAALGALAVIGVVAAGTGAYVANRQPSAPATSANAFNDPAVPTIAGSVNETENSIQTAPVAVPSQLAQAPAVQAPPTTPARTARREQPAARPRTARPAAEPTRSAYPSTTSNPSPIPAPEEQSSASLQMPGSSQMDREPLVPEPPQKQFEELVVPANSVIGLQIDNGVSSDRAKVEDEVRARVTRDVKVRDYVAIPAGSRAEGSVTLVEQGGRLKDQARLGIRFHTIVLADGTRMPISTETIYREGTSPSKESAAKIGGGAVGGAVVGAIFGGKKGALIGSTIGAGAGGAAVAASEPNPATLAAGSTVTVRTSSSATVTVEK